MNRRSYYMNEIGMDRFPRFMIKREVVFMDKDDNSKCIRGLRVENSRILEQHFNAFNYAFDFYKENRNIYISVAKYRFIPKFTYNLRDRSKETNEWFKEDSQKQIFEYDLLFDFDNKENKEGFHDEVESFYNLLLNEGIKFYMVFSGSGYQIVIPSGIWGFNGDLQKAINLTVQIRERFNLKFLDVKGIGVHNKIMKCPFTLAGDYIVFPIDKHFMKSDDWKDKELFNYKKQNIAGYMGVYNNKENPLCFHFKQFCYKYDIKEVLENG